MQVNQMEYQLIYPPDFDDLEPLVADKGWFAAALIVAGGRTYQPVFFSFGRLGQEYADSRASGHAAYVEKNLVILPEVTRATIDAAVAELARRGFVDLAADVIEP
jgi:hypothetical protein